MRIQPFLAVAALCGGIGSAVSGELYFISSTNSAIGHGLTFDVPSWSFDFKNESDPAVPGDLHFLLTSADHNMWFDIHFRTPDGSPFHTGLYLDAESTTSGAQIPHPILSLSSSLGGYVHSTGFIDVAALEEQSNGQVTGGTFVFHQIGQIDMTGNGSGSVASPFEAGYFRFEGIPVAVPEPSAFTLFGLGVGTLLLLLKVRRGDTV